MKFLCPSCKAKYQIADEKVAGRSVRMKCRKCGHMIHVSSDDAIGGSSAPPPPDDATLLAAGRSQAQAAPPAPPAPKVEPAAPSPPPRSAPKAAQAPVRPQAPMAPPPKPRPPAKSAPLAAPPKPASRPLVERPAPAARPAPVVESPKPAPVSVARAAEPAPVIREQPRQEEEATQVAHGALVGALSAAITEHAPVAVADPLAMPGDEWFVGINGVPVGPIRLSELRAKAAAGAITKESLVWRDGFEEWRPLKSFPELVAIVEESLSSARASLPFPTPGSAPSAIADPFGATAPATTSLPNAAPAPASTIDDLQLLQRRPRTSPAAWIAIVVALLFGLTLGFVLFGRLPSAPVESGDKPSSVPSQAPSVAAPAASQPREPTEEAPATPEAKSTKSGSGTKTTGKADTDTRGTSSKSGGLGLSGLSANGTRGPNDGSSSTNSSGSGGGQLDQAQLTSVITRYTPSVKRSCWQPALDGRDKDAPTSARVAVAITIGPSGSVQDVAVQGGDPRGYRGLAQCIAGRVRGWQFPASGGTTTVNVPFVFVAQ